MNPLRLLLLYAQDATNKTLSYQYGWPRYFQRHPQFRCTPINVHDRRITAQLRGNLLARWGRFDAIVMLHSVFSNAPTLGGWLFDGICKARQPKIFFIGNEYKLMPEKMAFCEALNLALLVTQSTSPAVQDLYRNRLGCPIYAVPYTGLDTELFYPTRDTKDRPIDIGYRSYDSPVYLGHNERRLLADFSLITPRAAGCPSISPWIPRIALKKPPGRIFSTAARGNSAPKQVVTFLNSPMKPV